MVPSYSTAETSAMLQPVYSVVLLTKYTRPEESTCFEMCWLIRRGGTIGAGLVSPRPGSLADARSQLLDPNEASACAVYPIGSGKNRMHGVINMMSETYYPTMSLIRFDPICYGFW